MLNIINHQGNANLNHNKLSPHTCQNAYHQKEQQITGVVDDVEQTPCILLVGMHICSHYGKQYGNFSKTIKTTCHMTNNFTSGYIPKENKNTNLKRYTHINVHCSIITTAKIRKQPKCSSINEWVKKMWYTYAHDRILHTAIRKNEILPFTTTQMNLECIMPSRINQRKTNPVSYQLHVKSKIYKK